MTCSYWVAAAGSLVIACCFAALAVCLFLIASYANHWLLWIALGFVSLVMSLFLVNYGINLIVCGAGSCVAVASVLVVPSVEFPAIAAESTWR